MAGNGRGATTRSNLMEAAVRLVAERGLENASVRAIAREAGVTEAVLYKHFRNKDELWRDVYSRIVKEMVREKAALLGEDDDTRTRLARWVELTYAYYDGNRDAFNYVLLAPTVFAESMGDVYTRQGELFMELVRQGQRAGEIRAMDPTLACGLFAGLLLGVPRMINEGRLQGPAMAYAQDVTHAAWRALGISEEESRRTGRF